MYKSHETYKGLKISLYSIIHAIKFLLQHEIVIFPRPVVKHLEFLLAIHVKKKKTNQSFCQLSMLKKKNKLEGKITCALSVSLANQTQVNLFSQYKKLQTRGSTQLQDIPEPYKLKPYKSKSIILVTFLVLLFLVSALRYFWLAKMK